MPNGIGTFARRSRICQIVDNILANLPGGGSTRQWTVVIISGMCVPRDPLSKHLAHSSLDSITVIRMVLYVPIMIF